MFETIKDAHRLARSFAVKAKGNPTFLWREGPTPDNPLPCTAGNSLNEAGEEIVVGGLLELQDIVIRFNLEDMPDGIGPVKGHYVTFKEKEYVVNYDRTGEYGINKEIYCSARSSLLMRR